MKYRVVIGFIGWAHAVLGVVFLVNGMLLGVEAIPLYVDVAFCLCVGAGILAINGKLQKAGG